MTTPSQKIQGLEYILSLAKQQAANPRGPISNQGRQLIEWAEQAISEMRECCDSLSPELDINKMRMPRDAD